MIILFGSIFYRDKKKKTLRSETCQKRAWEALTYDNTRCVSTQIYIYEYIYWSICPYGYVLHTVSERHLLSIYTSKRYACAKYTTRTRDT